MFSTSTRMLFKHHGPFAPGIFLFRRIGFTAKAASVSAAFLLPLAVVTWNLHATATTNIAFSAKELQGTAYGRPALTLLHAAVERRLAAVLGGRDPGAEKDIVVQAFEALAKRDATQGEALGTRQAFTSLAAAHRRVLEMPQTAPLTEKLAAHDEFISHVQAVLRDATDGSNLTLDPDLDTFYLMDAALLQTPHLLEAMGALRRSGSRAIGDHRMDAATRDEVAVAHAETGKSLESEHLSLARAIKARPTLSATLDAGGAEDAAKAFLAQAKASLLGDMPVGEADVFLAKGNAAITVQFQLGQRTLDALDVGLNERIANLKQTLAMQLTVAGVGVALALYLFVSFYRVTLGGLREVGRNLERMAAGDLTGKPMPWGRDEAASLMLTLADTIASLRRMVGQVRSATSEMEFASGEIAAASMDLSQRTEQTAARLQDAASQMHHIDAIARQTASVADGAAAIVAGNGQAAARGAEVIQEANATMQSIEAASRKISEIIGTIDGIAFQTNILALNAAVEAARAGDAGRGFAVVASEVRALSNRSTEAARQVKQLIAGNRERVESGAKVIDSAGKAMLEIVQNADRIQGLITRISQATAEQTQGIGDVGTSMRALDTGTQQDAALVEESAATASSLHDSAARLAKEMERFKVE